jgi:carboxymethylenebutenolidase
MMGTTKGDYLMGEWIEIATGDRAYRSVPGSESKARVLLLHAWWGLNQLITELADRLAEDGFTVLAPDLFDGVVLDTISDADAHVEEVEVDADVILAKVQRALDALLAGQRDATVGVIGFSFGAAYGHLLTSKRSKVEAVVDFYGGMGFDVPERPGGVWPAYLGHFAADDPYEEEESAGVAYFHTRLQELDARSAAYLYPGTKHWFFEADRPEHNPESAQLAYERTIQFLTESLSDGDVD